MWIAGTLATGMFLLVAGAIMGWDRGSRAQPLDNGHGSGIASLLIRRDRLARSSLDNFVKCRRVMDCFCCLTRRLVDCSKRIVRSMVVLVSAGLRETFAVVKFMLVGLGQSSAGGERLMDGLGVSNSTLQQP